MNKKISQKQLIFVSSKQSSFEATEIQWAKQYWHEILLITAASKNPQDNKEEFLHIQTSFTYRQKVVHVLRFFRQLFWLFIKDLFSMNSSIAYIKQWRKNFSMLLKVSMQTESLKTVFFENQNSTPYSIFSNDQSLILAFAKHRGYINHAASRAHGRDVIEYREPVTQKLPFQWFKYQELDAVYSVSRYTQSYIQNKYPSYANKIRLMHLGTKDKGMGPTIPNESECFVIASIGAVRNVKRFFLIAEMLRFTGLKVKWIHFGNIQYSDATTNRFLKALNDLKSTPNISVDLKGYVSNELILEYFSENFIDALVSVSESEGGAPVSIQEAASFGIPCFATNVGGTNDIVNDITGKLIDKDFDLKEGMIELENLLLGFARSIENRKAIRGFWERNFKASINYPKFFDYLRETESYA